MGKRMILKIDSVKSEKLIFKICFSFAEPFNITNIKILERVYFRTTKDNVIISLNCR